MRRPKSVCSFERAADPQQISSLWFLVILAAFCGIFVACHSNFNNLPRPNLSDDDTVLQFNARRARSYLTDLTSLGPKVAGSEENEQRTVEYLLSELDSIRNAMKPSHKLDVTVQVANGSIRLSSSATYRGVQNVVARLSSSDKPEPEHCLLINSHFDTVSASPGGGDAASMVSVMLETIRVLSLHDTPFEHGILFLFNGCEESFLQGSHAFVTQHQWAPCAKALVNLDAAGNGGREIMFQASKGHSWLMNYYRKYVPHPFASAMGEELFQANLIPSDTDFRIFRDYGQIPGMDLAYSTNGYVYHTEHDTAEIVPDGTLQNTGDNVLALVRALANAEELKDTAAHVGEADVFFDFMNLFMISYTKNQSIIINVTVIVVCLILQIAHFILDQKLNKTKVCFWSTALLIMVQLISLALGCGAAFGFGYFYIFIDHTMSWYNNSYLIFLLYMCPKLFFMSLGPAILRRLAPKKMRPWQSVERMLNFHSWILIILLIVTTALNIRTGFMVMVPLLFYTISLIMQLILKLFRVSASLKLIGHYVVQLVPFVFYSTWTIIAFATFIPFAGRNGVTSNAEFLISIFGIGMGLLLSGFLVPTVPMYKSPIGVSLIFAILWVIGMILMVTPIGFPYAKGIAPQRQNIHHVHRTFYNLNSEIRRESSEYFIRGSDPNNHLIDYLSGQELLDRVAECRQEWLCGLPMLYNAQQSGNLLAARQPVIPSIESELTMTESSQVNSSTWRFEFELTCPNHCVIYISPADSTVTLGRWSLFQHLEDTNQAPNNPWLYSSSYFNLFLDRPELDFWIEMNIPAGSPSVNHKFNVGILAHYSANNRHAYTEEFKDLLKSLPDWMTTTDWISTYKSYEF